MLAAVSYSCVMRLPIPSDNIPTSVLRSSTTLKFNKQVLIILFAIFGYDAYCNYELRQRYKR